MLKVPVESAAPGAVVAKPITNGAGIVLIAAGAEVSDTLKRKLISMGINELFIEGKCVPDIPKDELIAKINLSFRKAEEDPRMAEMKRALLAHIEELY